MRITIHAFTRGHAVVRAESARTRNGKPEAVIELRLQLPADATRSDAKELALQYIGLDFAPAPAPTALTAPKPLAAAT